MDEEINDLKPTESIDSTNSNTPLQNKKQKSNQYIHAPKQDSLHDENNATMIINETDLEHIELDIEEEEEEHKQSTPPIEMIHSPSIVINHNIENNENNPHDNEYSQTLSNETRDTRKSHSVDSITQRTDFSNKPKSPNPLDTTTLQHQGDDVQIGAGDHSPPFHNARMPSISYNNMDKELAALRRASRRKWWSPTRLCDWCMHKLIFGKIMVMILTWTTVIDYGKDLYVAYHFGLLSKWWEFSVTLCILFLSLRLMLYIRAIDDSHISFWKLLIFYLPGSVYADFQIDRFSDVGVCLFWEIAILFGTPFVPFFLIYLAMRKSISLFSISDSGSFENPYLLSYAVIECIFETLPQLCLQTYLYFTYNKEIEFFVFIIAWIISILVLIKIPIVVWYNWRIVYKLSFKRRHNGEIISIKYHPIQDIVATGSWDHTILINSIISKDNMHNIIKAKRVLDHHYNINCIIFHPKQFDIIACAGQGVELFNWRIGKTIATFPKTKERDQLRRKKRHRTKEVKQCLFSPDGNRLIWCQGKNILIWDIINKKELLKIKCIQGNRLGDVQTIDISPNGKYIAAGLYQNKIKVFNSYNKDLIRVLEGHIGSINTIKFDRQGKYIISGGSDSQLILFDLRSGQKLKTFNKHSSDIMSIAIDYNNKYIASVGRDKLLYIIYLSSLQPLKKWIPYKTQRDIRCVDFSPYGDTIAAADEDHKVHILTLPKECHIKHNRFSTDFGHNKLPIINDNDQVELQNNHQKQYSNIDAITTNDYNKFDPKEHNIN